TLGDIKLSAEATDGGQVIPGTIAWEAPLTTVPAAGQATYRWTFTPDDTMQYLTASNTIRFSVDKATPTGEPKYTAITSGGKTLADAGLTAEGGTFSVPGTVKWADAADTAVKANTAYTWKFTPKDTVNYTELTGSITLYRVSSSGGGGGSSVPTYKPSVAPSKDGTTAVSNPNPKKGDTVTITPKPADGNEVSKVIVTDKNGKTIEVKANADGTYRFVQPDSAVAIQVVYQPKQTAQTDFADVSAAHFAYDAVKWAAENGITGGIGDNLFAPSQSCTRAQIVTFLWRAAGSPEPKSLSGLTDVPADAYYAKAVAWAVENGITGGIGDGLFAPDATCTRAQSVTFLARALNAKANGKADFTDVPADSYYAEAVAWAVENGVTNGMGDNRFAPNQHCTRAQIVTFLYRAYNGK
ncbi:S-layer homology domain-containing protein, partial [uncultured Agathobaculum sp.]|uniref:S-layer homology domain-containing protein n=1 Tax=uncultured Agathobaculum sp. TaxID=2048140 RepID=UPI00296F0D9B